MPRKYIDCRECPSESNGTVAISADSEKELLDVPVQHAGAVRKHQGKPEFRDQWRHLFKDGTSPLRAAQHV